jgi:hypothetical protein
MRQNERQVARRQGPIESQFFFRGMRGRDPMFPVKM